MNIENEGLQDPNLSPKTLQNEGSILLPKLRECDETYLAHDRLPATTTTDPSSNETNSDEFPTTKCLISDTLDQDIQSLFESEPQEEPKPPEESRVRHESLTDEILTFQRTTSVQRVIPKLAPKKPCCVSTVVVLQYLQQPGADSPYSSSLLHQIMADMKAFTKEELKIHLRGLEKYTGSKLKWSAGWIKSRLKSVLMGFVSGLLS